MDANGSATVPPDWSLAHGCADADRADQPRGPNTSGTSRRSTRACRRYHVSPAKASLTGSAGDPCPRRAPSGGAEGKGDIGGLHQRQVDRASLLPYASDPVDGVLTVR